MWDAFELSVKSFISLLEDDDERRDLAVSRWQERSWTVRSLVVPPPVPYPFADTHAVTAVSATTISIPLPKQER